MKGKISEYGLQTVKKWLWKGILLVTPITYVVICSSEEGSLYIWCAWFIDEVMVHQ